MSNFRGYFPGYPPVKLGHRYIEMGAGMCAKFTMVFLSLLVGVTFVALIGV
jgi:hypothetical protein